MKKSILLAAWAALPLLAEGAPLVIQTDFGTKDGAVAEMKGIALTVDPAISLHDLSHENTPYHIWEAAYRLKQTAPYWPAGTVFVSVIDPGVGTARRSVVLQTKSGHFFVGPDNGSWTLVAEELGIAAVRLIDEKVNRRPGSERSYTFHGRDIYAYAGARLATGAIAFDQVGPLLPPEVVSLPYRKAAFADGAATGTLPLVDFHFGNLWTNIPEAIFEKLQPKYGDRFLVTVARADREVYRGVVPYVRTFGDVPEGQPLLYINSLLDVAFALNMGNFAKAHGLEYGGEWTVAVRRAP